MPNRRESKTSSHGTEKMAYLVDTPYIAPGSLAKGIAMMGSEESGDVLLKLGPGASYPHWCGARQGGPKTCKT